MQKPSRPWAMRLGAVLAAAALSVGATPAVASAVARSASCPSSGAGLPPAGAASSDPMVRALATACGHWGEVQLTPAARGLLGGPLGRALDPAALGQPRRIPKPGTTSALQGVACTSAGNCWAVGQYSAGAVTRNLVLHWNGRKWQQVAVPNQGGTAANDISTLFGVRCRTRTDCWAFGYSHQDGKGESNQALHWNGSKWSKVSTPNPGGTAAGHFNQLADVSCTSAGNCWAAGEYGTFSLTGEQTSNEMLRWNGKKWSHVSVINPEGNGPHLINELGGIRCTSAKNCWAVGSYGREDISLFGNEALRWNGKKWLLIATPDPGGFANGDVSVLSGLSCTSADNCWAVGYDGSVGSTITLLNETLYWDGTTWSQVDVPDPDGTGAGAFNRLTSVHCAEPTKCWAAGFYGSIDAHGLGSILDEALRWNGVAWRPVGTPDPAGTSDGDANYLNAIQCVTTSNCWAVGDSQANGGSDLATALHWNGTTWSSK